MQDDPRKIDVVESISIAQYPEIRDWCKELGCTEIELAEAVGVVGHSAAKVRTFLARGPQSRMVDPPFAWGKAVSRGGP